jgi:hypothetical protein
MQPHNQLQITKEVQIFINDVILCTIDMHLHNLKPILFHNTFGKKQHVNPPCLHNNNFFIMNTSHDFWNSKKIWVKEEKTHAKPKTKPPSEPPNSILITLALPSLFDEQNNVLQS